LTPRTPDARKRVLFLSPFASVGGGAERVLLDHIRFIDRARYEPFVAVIAPGSFADTTRSLGVETYVSEPHSDARPLSMLRELARFGAYVKKKRIDVIVGNKYRSILYWGLSLARRSKFVWLLHDPPIERGAKRFLVGRIMNHLHPSWTVWVTPESRQIFTERFAHLRGENSSDIRPGTCPEDLAQGDAARARRRWQVPDGAPVLSVFARLQPSKGHLDLVAAAPLILKQHPETRFLLCGGTQPGTPMDHENAVRAAIAAAGLSERVLLLGMISEQEKCDVLAATTILVHPAQWEPFGIAVIEGMAVGKPVVVADARGPSYIVEHEKTGLVTPKGQPEALASAVSSLLGDPRRAADMGARALERVNERYHVRVAAQRLEAIIERITGGLPLPETHSAAPPPAGSVSEQA
jgi:glycosyltransferase involved in cell wall biosynthesis